MTTETAPPAPPETLGDSGRALWTEVLGEFELAEHELALLRQAGETLDAIDRLQAALAGDEVIVASPQGQKVNPCLPELRQQRVTFGRLIAMLDVPLGDEDTHAKKQRRATRGAYKLRAVE
jgi:hypothetical protein